MPIAKQGPYFSPMVSEGVSRTTSPRRPCWCLGSDRGAHFRQSGSVDAQSEGDPGELGHTRPTDTHSLVGVERFRRDGCQDTPTAPDVAGLHRVSLPSEWKVPRAARVGERCLAGGRSIDENLSIVHLMTRIGGPTLGAGATSPWRRRGTGQLTEARSIPPLTEQVSEVTAPFPAAPM